jgi:sugar phosphate isomerase/epimerase
MERLSRRSFLKSSAASGIGLVFGGRTSFPFQPQSASSFLSGIGICASISDAGALKSAGCDFIEEGVRRLLLPDGPEEQFETKLAELKSIAFPVPACNGFVPGTLKAVGPEANHAEILAYAGMALRRAARAGIKVIVWGSGESRNIPDGFSRGRAEEQFRELAVRIAPLADGAGVVLALEPLQSSETNFINNLREGAALVEAVGHPSFRLLADLYHMMREAETPESIDRFGKLIHHCHVAEKDKRTPPGTAGNDFKPYLKALNRIGYRGRMSLECRWENMTREAPAAVAALRKQVEESAG